MQKEEIKKQLERLLKPFRIPFRRDGEPLTEEQKRRRARFVVYRSWACCAWAAFT